LSISSDFYADSLRTRDERRYGNCDAREQSNGEKQQGITEKRKHRYPKGRPVSTWQQIFGRKPREDECMCGQLLTKHEDGRCPGVQNDTHEADRAVIETLLGRRRLEIMERRGVMTVKEFEVEDT
jgi:hypothetical protein